MQTQTLAPKNMSQTIEKIKELQGFAEGESFSMINIDLLSFLMSEFIGSESFIKIPSDRRKELFNQYIKLERTLNCLDAFLSKGPDLLNDRDSIIDFLSTLKSLGEDGGFEEIKSDLLTFAMPKMVGSDSFANIPNERREDLFNQYGTLSWTLDSLHNIVK